MTTRRTGTSPEPPVVARDGELPSADVDNVTARIAHLRALNDRGVLILPDADDDSRL